MADVFLFALCKGAFAKPRKSQPEFAGSKCDTQKKPQVLLILRFFCMVKPYCGPKTKGLLGLEFKDRGGVVCFTGAQYGAWKFILVGRVREVLGFKAESVAVIIRFAFFPAHSF